MSAERELFLMGLSHKTASLEVRERCAQDPEAARDVLTRLCEAPGIEEAWLLSTCNRTEVLLVAERDPLERGAIEGVVRQALFGEVPHDATYRFRGVESVIHLFRVCSGLDSLVLGESQIFSQMKDALTVSREAGTCGRMLERLLKRALVTGKRVRTETEVGAGTLSVARAGVGIARHVVGRFDDAHAVIVGAGQTGKLVGQHLNERRIGRLTIVNRTFERARTTAEELGGAAERLEALPLLLADADLIVVCVDGAPNLVKADAAARRRLDQRDRPLVVVDLSVPRAVDRSVAEHDDVFAYDMDEIAAQVDTNQRARQQASEAAAPILIAEVHKYLSLQTYASFSPAIARLRERFEAVREEELDAIAGDQANGDLLQLAHKLTSHLLDVALDGLKDSARESIEPETLESAYQRFLREQ